MSSTRDRLEDLARDLDMVVFRLEREAAADDADVEAELKRILAERRRMRRDLEGLRDRLEELARGM
jgi:hypothetical protein